MLKYSVLFEYLHINMLISRYFFICILYTDKCESLAIIFIVYSERR